MNTTRMRETVMLINIKQNETKQTKRKGGLCKWKRMGSSCVPVFSTSDHFPRWCWWFFSIKKKPLTRIPIGKALAKCTKSVRAYESVRTVLPLVWRRAVEGSSIYDHHLYTHTHTHKHNSFVDVVLNCDLNLFNNGNILVEARQQKNIPKHTHTRTHPQR